MATNGQIDIGDVNNDGYGDLLVSLNGFSARLHLGDESLKMATQIDTGVVSRVGRFADINDDGLLDVIGAGIGYVYGALGDGTGSFNALNRTTSVTGAGHVAAADIDGDGQLDIAVSAPGNLDIYMAETQQVTTIAKLNLLTQESSKQALDNIEVIRTRLTNERGAIGSNLSRMNTALSNLQATTVNYSQAESRISDVDVADEMGKLVAKNILQKATSAVLAISNQSTEIALSLLNFE